MFIKTKKQIISNLKLSSSYLLWTFYLGKIFCKYLKNGASLLNTFWDTNKYLPGWRYIVYPLSGMEGLTNVNIKFYFFVSIFTFISRTRTRTRTSELARTLEVHVYQIKRYFWRVLEMILREIETPIFQLYNLYILLRNETN